MTMTATIIPAITVTRMTGVTVAAARVPSGAIPDVLFTTVGLLPVIVNQ